MKPANCGFLVDWSAVVRERFAGSPLKNIALSHGDTRVRGEALVTETGLEGGAVYALSAVLRDAIAADGGATLAIDFRPDVDEGALAARLAPKNGQSVSTLLRKAGLPPVAAALMREAAPLPKGAEGLARRAKHCEIRLIGACADCARDLDRRRRRLERTRCRLHADPAPRRVRRRRDDRLGGADRRLSAASLLLDGRRGGARRGALRSRGGCGLREPARSA